MKRLGFAACVVSAALLGACDFGTLDTLNTESNIEGGDVLTNKAYALWRSFAANDDDATRAATRNLEQVIATAGSLPIQVKIGRLTKDDLAPLGLQNNEPGNAQGMLVITQLECSLDDIQRVLIARNQPTLYPGVFDTYERTYKTSIDDFLGGKAKQLDWSTTYTASALGVTYESTVLGSARRVKGGTAADADVLVGRLYQAVPARITKGDNASYEQDYETALYYPTGPKTTLHFYGIWRQLNVSGLSSDSEFYIASTLGNLIDFEVRTSKVCRDGQPAPTF